MDTNNVVKFPPPKRFTVDDYLNEQKQWDWHIVEVTGNETLVYIQGEESPWAGETLEQIITNAANYEYGYDTDDVERIKEVNLKILNEATKLLHNIGNPNATDK